jgi:hypothetical protein
VCQTRAVSFEAFCGAIGKQKLSSFEAFG